MGKMRDLVRGPGKGSRPSTVPPSPGVGHNSPPEEDDGTPGNYIKMNRGVRFHPLVGFDWSKPRSAFEAWYDLLCMAKYKPEEVISRGQIVTLDRGQLLAARGWLAKRWLWTERQVRSWIADLERDGAVIWAQNGDGEASGLHSGLHRGPIGGLLSDGTPGPNQPSNRYRSAFVLTICNYSRYQHFESEIEQYVAKTNGLYPAKTNGLHSGLDHGPLSGQSIKEIIDINKNPPTPQGGTGANGVAYENGHANGHAANGSEFALTPDPVPPKRVRRRKTVGLHGLTPEQLDEAWLITDSAYNYKPAVRSLDRDNKLARRIEEIGGLANYRRAVAAIPLDDWFAGRVPPIPPKRHPFQFEFDTLLSKELGKNKTNVLMRLLDLGNENVAKLHAPNGERIVTADEVSAWDDQRQEAEIRLALKSKGAWSLGKWWRSPGHPDCRFRRHLIAKYRLKEIFDEHGLRRRDAERVIDELRQAIRVSHANGVIQ